MSSSNANFRLVNAWRTTIAAYFAFKRCLTSVLPQTSAARLEVIETNDTVYEARIERPPKD
jgi:hypothetical protein